jgi:hypothetical protein
MSIPLALTAASTFLGFMGSNKAANAEALRAEQQARQMEIDRKLAEAQALEAQNLRISEYNLARSSNNAQFSFQLGGGESSSLAAFERFQRETMSSDVASSQRLAAIEGSSRSVAAMIERQRGVSAKSVARINNLSRLFELGADLSKTYVPKTYTPTKD